MRSLKTSTALALVFGFGAALTGLPAAAQQTETGSAFAGSAVCDRDGNGYISGEEADWCAERDATTLFGESEEGMTEEQFSETYGDLGDTEGMFGEIDADEDDRISQQEWRDWREQGFAEATQDTENGMPADEYEDWNAGFPEGAGDQGIDEGSRAPADYGEEQQEQQ